MHGQHYLYIWYAYFKQLRSASLSDPLLSDAFLQYGNACLNSSTHCCYLSTGQSVLAERPINNVETVMANLNINNKSLLKQKNIKTIDLYLDHLLILKQIIVQIF